MRVKISRFETTGKITLQESGGMAIVTIYRPQAKNAMTKKMWQEVDGIAKQITKNPKNKVVILKGNKEQFTAGSDIKEFNQLSIREANEIFQTIEEALSSFERLPLPTIALIDGPAMGAGLELALSCDLRIGTNNAKVGMPIARLGITLSQQFVNRIITVIGKSKTLDLVYTGRIVGAQEALQWGLLNYLTTEGEDIVHDGITKAQQIMEQSPASVLSVKRSVAHSSPNYSFPWGSKNNNNVDPYDFPEGVQSFIEKRKPNFEGRD